MIQEARHALRSALRALVEGLTCHPEYLEFEVTDQQIGVVSGLVVTLRVHRGDFGRVLGERGANFWALQNVAERIGFMYRTPVKLAQILEPVFGEPDRVRFRPNCNWPAGRVALKIAAESAATHLFGDEKAEATFRDADDGTWRTFLLLRSRVVGSQNAIEPLSKSLAKLLDAAGRKHGRIVELEMQVVPGEPDWQPVHADGRFAREKAANSRQFTQEEVEAFKLGKPKPR